MHPGFPLPDAVFSDTFFISLRVGDDGVPQLFDEDIHQVIVTRSNLAPIADAGGPYFGKVGDTICFDGTGSHDNDSGDYVAAYYWDINGNGVFPYEPGWPQDASDSLDCTDSICCYAFDYPFSGFVGLVVEDKWGARSDEADAYVQLDIAEIDARTSNGDILCTQVGDTFEICAIVHGDAEADTTFPPFWVVFYDGEPGVSGTVRIDSVQVVGLDSGGVDTVCVTWVNPDNDEHMIYVVVDDNDDLSEFDEGNNVAIKTISPCVDNGRCIMFPYPMYYAYAFLLSTDSMWFPLEGGPVGGYADSMLTDPNDAPIYVGGFTSPLSACDLDLTSLVLNGVFPIDPGDAVCIPGGDSLSVPIFPGEDVLRVYYDMKELAQYYIDLHGDAMDRIWDTIDVTYEITGVFTDQSPFSVCGSIPFIGHTSGDVNNDRILNIADLTYLVGYLFTGGNPPLNEAATDMDHNGSINVADLTLLVNRLFFQ
jgi:hypothetical protein